jgi:hypothetical protein
MRDEAIAYNAQLTHVFDTDSENEKPANPFATLVARLPKFEQADGALSRIEARLDGLKSKRERRFVQNSVVTAATIAFLSSSPVVKGFKPTEPAELTGEAIVAFRENLSREIMGEPWKNPKKKPPPNSHAEQENETHKGTALRLASLEGFIQPASSTHEQDSDEPEIVIPELHLTHLCSDPDAYFDERIGMLESVLHERELKMPGKEKLKDTLIGELSVWCQEVRLSMIASAEADRIQDSISKTNKKLEYNNTKLNKILTRLGQLSPTGEDSFEITLKVTELEGDGGKELKDYLQEKIDALELKLDVELDKLKLPENPDKIAPTTPGASAPKLGPQAKYLQDQILGSNQALPLPVMPVATPEAIKILSDSLRDEIAKRTNPENGEPLTARISLEPDLTTLRSFLESLTGFLEQNPPPLSVELKPNPTIEEFVSFISNSLNTRSDGNKPPELLVGFVGGTPLQEGQLECAPLARFFYDVGDALVNDIYCAAQGPRDSRIFKPGYRQHSFEKPTCVPTNGEVNSRAASHVDDTLGSLASYLSSIGQFRARNPGDFRDQIVVVGYTDSLGPEARNDDIAVTRALGIMNKIDPDSTLSRNLVLGEPNLEKLPPNGEVILQENPLSRRVDVLHCKPKE